jgi:hypothetical protein
MGISDGRNSPYSKQQFSVYGGQKRKKALWQ